MLMFSSYLVAGTPMAEERQALMPKLSDVMAAIDALFTASTTDPKAAKKKRLLRCCYFVLIRCLIITISPVDVASKAPATPSTPKKRYVITDSQKSTILDVIVYILAVSRSNESTIAPCSPHVTGAASADAVCNTRQSTHQLDRVYHRKAPAHRELAAVCHRQLVWSSLSLFPDFEKPASRWSSDLLLPKETALPYTTIDRYKIAI